MNLPLCYHCDEPVDPAERAPAEQPFRTACFMRLIVGSVGHLRGTCSCYGGTEEDPPDLSKREAASAAWAFFRAGPEKEAIA